MNKRIFRLTLLLVLSLALLSSCAEENMMEDANITFSITNDRARTISSGDERTKITSYRFTLSGTADYTETFAKNSEGTYLIKGVAPGSYTVKVEALTSDSTVVSEGSASHFFVRGDNKFSITLNSLLGQQELVLTFLWNTSSYQSEPEFSITLTDENDNNISIAGSELSVDKANGKAVLKKTLNAGSYLVIARLHSGAVSYIGYTEVVRLTNGGSALTATIDFKKGGAVDNSAVITENVDVPVEGEITASILSNGKIKAVLSFTSLPHGVNESDISITWYNEYYRLSGKEKEIEFYGLPGNTRITAVMKCSKTGSMGSVSIDFDNTGTSETH